MQMQDWGNLKFAHIGLLSKSNTVLFVYVEMALKSGFFINRQSKALRIHQ